ncbi:hypothetical protein DNK47_01850 [Mycoplasma wenyonii]|uniref:Uncharacterized protein n=1 Tax=Mycoplasma wenyonii TaxID=65123 RepID=A0A328PRR8_9MOLU|nr:hypothetical protein [Mycoplasma wenyonii]RAO95007.1 hypothetical protein DNK47_01850 [Mycoplasma wenyonii]
MFGLIKGLLTVSLGAGGVGAVVYGVTSTKSSSNYWDHWKKTVTTSDSEILLCDAVWDKYEGIMKVSNDGKNDMGLGLTVDFQVTQWLGAGGRETGTKRNWTRKWGDNAKGSDDWAFWKISFSGDKKVEDLWYWETNTTGGGYTTDQKVSKCQGSKIRLRESAKVDEVANKNIRFDINKDSCQENSDSVTCDIVFASGSSVEWVDGFKPKITYTRPS